MITKYFDTIEQAKKFIQSNKLKNYFFTTPEFLENGVDLNFTINEQNIKN